MSHAPLDQAELCPPQRGPLRVVAPRALALALGLGCITPATAQQLSFTSDSTISMPLSWSEVNGNNNGVLEPGESAALRLDVSFTNHFGTAHFSPPVGTFSSGTIMGFGSGYIDVMGAGGAAGAFNLGVPPGGPLNNGTTGYGVRSGWRIVGTPSHGSVNASGTGVVQIQFGQFAHGPEPSTANATPRMYALLWTPSDYRARTVTFAVDGHAPPAIASLVVDLDGAVAFHVYVEPDHLALGSIDIPIVPPPSVTTTFVIGSFALRRRRRGAWI